MRISRSATYAMGVTAALALLAGCSGGGLQSSSPLAPANGQSASAMGHGHGTIASPMSHASTFTSMHAPAHVHTNHHKSWVSPDVARAPRILFVSDDDYNEVFIYTMPGLALKGTLTGFSEPQGMCADKQGNIWITNTGTFQALKYSRTGTPLGSVSDPYGYPVGCAINPTNGDLALTDIFSDSVGQGGVVVFPNATGSPTKYVNPSQFSYYFPAYDTSGNLYADGGSNYGSFILSVLPSGGSSMSTVNVSGGSINFPGGMNWDRVNNQLVVGDQECGASFFGSCEYAMTVSGSSATITGSTKLLDYDGGACDADQVALAPFSKYMAGPCISEGSGLSAAGRWKYPAGGTPTNYNDSTVAFPIGSAISNK